LLVRKVKAAIQNGIRMRQAAGYGFVKG